MTIGIDTKHQEVSLATDVERLKIQMKWVEDQLGAPINHKPHGNLTDGKNTYPEKSTCHGLSYIFDSTSAAPRRMIWLILYLACASSYLYFAISATIEYLEFPVTSNIEYKYASEVTFPAVTICPTFTLKQSYYDLHVANGSLPALTSQLDYLKQQVVLQNVDLGKDVNLSDMTASGLTELIGEAKYQELGDQLVEDLNRINWEQHYTAGGHHPEDFMDANGDKCTFYSSAQLNNEIACKIRTFIPTDLGFLCHTVKFTQGGTPLKSTLGFMKIIISLKLPRDAMKSAFEGSPFIISIHALNDTTAQSEFELVSDVAFNSYKITMTNLETLPHPYGSCKDTEIEGFDNPLKSFPYYSRKACRIECEAEAMKEECGCTLPGYPLRSEVPVCIMTKDRTATKESHGMDLIQCARNVGHTAKCPQCVEACNTVNYEVEYADTNVEVFSGRVFAFTEIRK